MSFAYDGLLPISSTWAGTVAGSVSRTYDTDFRVASRSVNGGNTITFGYDNDSLLTSAGAETINYDPASDLRTGTTLGVVVDSFIYNGFAEVDSYAANVNASAVFSSFFVRDKLGRISQKTETVQGLTRVFDYTYDTAGRLTNVDRDSLPLTTYTYDSNGNRLNNGAVYDDQDRLLSQGSATYTYTPHGELLTKTNGSGTTTYNYDVLGNLISVILPSGTTIDYLVDGKNRRIGKKINGTLEREWLYQDGLNPIAELDGTGTVVSRFIYATRLNVPDFIIKGGVTYRVISDHLGSPRLVIDSTTGTVIQTIDFDVFGNVTGDTNPEFQPFGFAGGLYEPDTQLVRFGARDYDSEIGRWTSRDPIRFDGGGPNLYGYTQNDPINFVDPDGKAPKGERGQTGSRQGTNDPFKHTTPHPTDKKKVEIKNNQTGETKVGPRTPAFDEYWKQKEEDRKKREKNAKRKRNKKKNSNKKLPGRFGGALPIPLICSQFPSLSICNQICPLPGT